MSLFWVAYKTGVVILEAPDLPHARFKAAVKGFDQGAEFVAGHDLGPDLARRIPPSMTKWMLSPQEAQQLTRFLEQADPIPKRPAAASVRRRKKARSAAREPH